MNYLNQRGSLLIGLVIVITTIAVLGAGAVYLKSISAMGEVFENNQAKANYLAESGGRYGTGIMQLNGNSPEKISYSYSMDGGNSKFVLYVYTTVFRNNTSYVKFGATGIVNEGTWAEGKKMLTFEVYSSGTFGTYSSGTSITTKRCTSKCGI